MRNGSHRRVVAIAVAASVWGAAACGSNARRATPLAPSSSATDAKVSTVVDVPVTIDVNAGQTGTWNWAGQSVTMPAGSRYDNVSFSWYDYGVNAGQPTAFGRLYVLSQEFTGIPADLGSTTPGYLSQSAMAPVGTGIGSQGQGTEYVFPTDVALEGGHTYWFYTDAKGAFATSFSEDIYPGGSLYLTGVSANPFHVAAASGRMVAGVFVPAPPGVTVDANFRLRAAPR